MMKNGAWRGRFDSGVMSDPFVSIILRSYNEGWALRETLPALCAQDYKNWELIVVDSGSTDGSVELVRGAKPAHFVQITHEEYNPARVINQGMELARSEFGIFLNADATPQGDSWLRPLVMGLEYPQVAAVFGRQIPRPDCQAVFAHDYERCFGTNREATQWDHFFSMVSSGLRKDIWSRRGFLETMQYSEDDEYTRWCRAKGYRIVYVPESVVMHSHNYSPRQAYKRSFGEAKALAAVWKGAPAQINFPKTVLLGWTNDARRDLLFCSRKKCLREWPHALRIRWHQRRARLAGFREGWKFYRNGDARYGWAKPAADAGSAHHEKRFTLDGNDALENRLAGICEKVLAGVREQIPQDTLEALVLGGGYGRGQGGVLRTAVGEAPYNDLEFYVFLRGNRMLNERKFGQRLNALGERLAPEAGLHVEFKIESVARLRQDLVTMFSYDLICGHRIILGDEHVFAGCGHHRQAEKIPSEEATRLLFNRCTGLLLAKELLRKGVLTAEDSDFVGRNIAKAQLGIGDAVLAALGKYHWSCLERQSALNGLAGADGLMWLAEVKGHHAAGVQFKLNPQQISMPVDAFQAEHKAVSNLAQQVWLWLESRRLHREFSSTHEYAFSNVKKCAGSPVWRNVLLHAKTFGVDSICDGVSVRYPRERLLNALPLLLWDEPHNDLKVKLYLQKQLRTGASDWQGLVAAYKAVWPKFS
jgi:rhamnosyltransferase